MTRSKTLHCVFERDKGMREVDVNEIIKNIKEMCIEANHFLSKDMKEVYDAAAVEEESPLGRQKSISRAAVLPMRSMRACVRDTLTDI